MLSKLAPRLYSTVGGNSFSEVNLDISILLSEVMGGVGDVYLGPYMQFGAVGSFLFFLLRDCSVGVVGWGFCFGGKGVPATVRWFFLGRRGWGAWVMSGIWLRVGSGGGGGGGHLYEILVELGLLRRPIIVTPLLTSNLPSLLTHR